MKVALVNLIPVVSSKNYVGYNHGLGHLSAIAKQRGHATKLFIIDRANSAAVKQLNKFAPQVVLVYLATNQFSLFVHQLATNWRHLAVPLFVGGPHATCCPQEILALEGVTGVCIGEGERAVELILERLENAESFVNIPNLWTKQEGTIVVSPVGHYTRDLDSLPFPDRSIFFYERLIKTRSMNILGFEFFCTRGCPHHCAYCLNPYLRRLNGDKIPIRTRSPKSLVDEIQTVTSRYHYNGIIGFHDDIFTLQSAWLAEFAAMYRRRIGMPFWCNTHFANLSQKTVKLLRAAGCFRVQLGVECGNEHQRKTILGKSISNHQIVEITELLKRHHLKIVANFMLGIPGETEENILESIALCQKIAPDWVLLSTCCPYPGTSLYPKLVQANLLDRYFYANLSSDTYYSPSAPVVKTNVSPEQHRYYFDNFVRLAKIGLKSSI